MSRPFEAQVAPLGLMWHPAGMTSLAKTPEQIAELKRLQAELPLAIKRAAEASRTYGRPLEPKFLQRAVAEEAKVARIKEKISALSEGSLRKGVKEVLLFVNKKKQKTL